jgi:hypothetical protein
MSRGEKRSTRKREPLSCAGEKEARTSRGEGKVCANASRVGLRRRRRKKNAMQTAMARSHCVYICARGREE